MYATVPGPPLDKRQAIIFVLRFSRDALAPARACTSSPARVYLPHPFRRPPRMISRYATRVSSSLGSSGVAFSRAAPARLLHASAPARGGDHHEDHTLEPPFARLPLSTRPLPEEHELIWHDGVAPEACLDLDAPHLSPLQGLLAWLGGLAFFGSVFLAVRLIDHPSNKKTVRVCAPRVAVGVILFARGQELTKLPPPFSPPPPVSLSPLSGGAGPPDGRHKQGARRL